MDYFQEQVAKRDGLVVYASILGGDILSVNASYSDAEKYSDGERISPVKWDSVTGQWFEIYERE